MTRTALSLAALLVADAVGAQSTPYAPPPPPPLPVAPTPSASSAPAAPTESEPSTEAPPAVKPTLPRGAVLEEVSGTVADVDRKSHKLAVETATGMVTLALDRNTMVYTPGGLGTVLDVKLGSHVRAGRNADFLAYWVQVRGERSPGEHGATGEVTPAATAATTPAPTPAATAAPPRATTAGPPSAPTPAPAATQPAESPPAPSPAAPATQPSGSSAGQVAAPAGGSDAAAAGAPGAPADGAPSAAPSPATAPPGR